MKKIVLLLVVLFISKNSFAQDDALVFFADKQNVEASLADPITILTQAAIDRKQLHNTVIDERDVPVNEAYILEVKDAAGITVLAKSKWLNCVYVQGSQTNINALLGLSFVIEIEFADKGLNSKSFPIATQTKFEQENSLKKVVYNYGDATNQVEMLSVDFLHEQDFTGEGITMAILDSGFPNVFSNDAFSNAVAEGRILGTYDFAERQENVDGTGSHGAQTFSDIAGLLDGEFVGTAPKASYYLYRTEFAPTENPVEEAWWVEALERADSLGVYVTNTSLGYQDFDDSRYDHSYQDLDGQTTIAARGANHAFDKGMIVVTSAGNDGGGFTFVATPADAPGALTVGAVDSNGNLAGFSSIGPTVDGRIKPDVMAKGASAAVVDQFGNVTTNSGTSFSSPIMAGAVASLWQSRPESPNYQIMQLVREASSMFNNPSDEMGYGIPNFEEAYNALQLLSVEDNLLETNFALYPNPFTTELNISFPKDIEKATLSIYSVLGTKVLSARISSVDNRINTSALSSGIYIARITSENNTTSFKIVKQ